MFMIAVPWPVIWQKLYGSAMEDRRVYTEQLANRFLSIDVINFDSPLSYISGEFLWAWFLDLLVRTMGLPTHVAFGIITIVVVFTASLVVLRTAPAPYVLLLCNPIFVDLAFSQMRIALAISLASWAYLLAGNCRIGRVARLLLLAASCLIHTSAAVFIGLYIMCSVVVGGKFKQRSFPSYALLALLGTLTALVLGPLRSGFLATIDDRRSSAVYDSSSLKFYAVWLLLVVLLSLDWHAVIPGPVRSYSLAVLVAALVGVAVGSYPNRIIAISLPFFVAASSSLSTRHRIFFIFAYLGYVTIYWFYWLHLMP